MACAALRRAPGPPAAQGACPHPACTCEYTWPFTPAKLATVESASQRRPISLHVKQSAVTARSSVRDEMTTVCNLALYGEH
eukprot:6177994-Pleurochrysis_carterae.AAC.3